LASSKQPEPIPELFFDRGIGKNVAFKLTELGWIIHRITEHFPDDAQDIDDPVWMEFGLKRGWLPFHKDGRIRGNPSERRPIEQHQSPMFYLDNQQLSINEMVQRIHMNQNKIYRLARRRAVLPPATQSTTKACTSGGHSPSSPTAKGMASTLRGPRGGTRNRAAPRRDRGGTTCGLPPTPRRAS
jgi:PIN like domain